jgi:signal transduction histidine kinase
LATRQLNELLALSQEELAGRLQNLSVLNEELERRVAERTKELAHKQEDLESTIKELRELERMKDAFFNTISHDLRIPVTGILGYGEMLEEGLVGDLGPEQREFVQHIIEAARRMTGLLNDLLDFARLEAGRLAITPRPISLLELVQQALNTMRPAIERKQLSLRTDLPAELPDVLADPDRVIQVLSNLLSNATKFTPEGGTITVLAAMRPDGSALRVAVSDTGVGIPPEAMPHLFERFFQTEAGRRAGGTGLGLHISKSLIEAQGGAMGVESQPGRGSTFWFTLPLAAAEGKQGQAE